MISGLMMLFVCVYNLANNSKLEKMILDLNLAHQFCNMTLKVVDSVMDSL